MLSAREHDVIAMCQLVGAEAEEQLPGMVEDLVAFKRAHEAAGSVTPGSTGEATTGEGATAGVELPSASGDASAGTGGRKGGTRKA